MDSANNVDIDGSVRLSDITSDATATESILKHFGVKGMRWGVRKQRPSSSGGSSAQEPKKAKSGEQSSPTRSSDGRIRVAGAKKVEVPKPASNLSKPVHSMSDEELRQAIARINMERQFAQLTQKPAKGEAAKQFVVGVLKDVGSQQAKVLLNAVATQQMAKAGLPVSSGKKGKK